MAGFELKSPFPRQHQSKYVTFFHLFVNVWSNRKQFHRPPSYLKARSPGGEIPLVYVPFYLLKCATHSSISHFACSTKAIRQYSKKELETCKRCVVHIFFSQSTDVDVYPTRCQLKRQ